jgi:hypothetical protein
MSMSQQKPDSGEYERLLAELDRLEREQQRLDLRDEHALEEWQRDIDAVRERIRRFLLLRSE